MRIGIDCRRIWNSEKYEGAGVGHYIYFLVKTLAAIDRDNEYFLFFESEYNTKQLTFLMSNFHTVTWPPARDHILSKIQQQKRLGSILQKLKLDVFHAPAYTLPLWYNGKSILTVHDLAIYAHPDWFPNKQWVSTKLLVPRSMKSATKIIAVSNTTQKEIIERFHIPAARISMIYEGVNPCTDEQSSSDRGEQEKSYKDSVTHVDADQKIGTRVNPNWLQTYILGIQTLEPRKNIVRLIHAFEKLQQSIKTPMHLILAGKKGWKYQEIFQAIEQSACRDSIHYIGPISDDEKRKLLKGATLFACVSLWEGFGLCNLEAMACGVPVVASDIPAFREILEDAAYFVNPYDIHRITQGLEKLVIDPTTRSHYQHEGKKRAQTLSWQQCAEQTLRLYNVCRDQ